MADLSTQHFLLRLMTAADAPTVGEIYKNQFFDEQNAIEPLGTLIEKTVFTKRIIAESTIIWTIRTLSQPEDVIGDCALHHYSYAQKSIEIGGSLVPRYWGKGVMEEVFFAVMQYAVRTYVVKTFIAKTTIQNSKAIRFARKIGFETQTENNGELTMIKQVEEQAQHNIP